MANRPQETLNFKKGYGENFKKLRESRKLTQTELAEQIGYTNRTISLIEKEERKPTIEQLKIYCDKFNVSLDYLTGRTNTPYPDTQLVSEYTGLSEKSIEKLKRINHFNADGSENPDKSFIDILDRFIQSKYFSELIVYWESLHTHSTEWKEKELEEKHWNECGQIAHYSDELKEAKRLLKAAVDDLKFESQCRNCKHEQTGLDNICNGCRGNKYEWRYAAEALALIGEDTNVPASADDTNVGGKIDSDAVQIGTFAHQDGKKVPLVRNDNPENVIGHCILHDTDEGVMVDIHFENDLWWKKD